MAKKTNITFQPSSGNVFTDLKLPNAEEKQTKVRLIVIINRIIEDRGLTQADAARVLGTNQPKVSALGAYKLNGFSVSRLIHFLTLLGYDVIINIKPSTGNTATESVLVVQAA